MKTKFAFILVGVILITAYLYNPFLFDKNHYVGLCYYDTSQGSQDGFKVLSHTKDNTHLVKWAKNGDIKENNIVHWNEYSKIDCSDLEFPDE